MALVQLEGVIRFDTVAADGTPTGSPTDLSAEILSLVVTTMREAVTSPPTFANAENVPKAGAATHKVQVNFLHDEATAASFSNMVWTAMQTDRGELQFKARFKNAVVGVTNPEYTGIMVCTELDLGGTPGQDKNQSKTFPVRLLTKATA